MRSPVYRIFVRCSLAICTGWSCVAAVPALADPAVYEIGHDPGVGFNLISWWSGTQASHWQAGIQTMYDAGFRDVSISPLRFFNTSTGALTTSGAPSLTGLASGVAFAKSLGMHVTLNPFVEPINFTMWRGQYNPSGAAATTFWTGYQSYLLEVAQIAHTHNVDAMLVGTELRAITRDSSHNADWNNAINAVRAVYDGPLGYAANWDNYNHPNVAAAIWEHPEINFMGIDSYFNNVVTAYASSVGATNAQLNNALDNNIGLPQIPGQSLTEMITAAWNRKLDNEILPYAAARKDGAGLPVVFTEFGHLPYNRTARSPQNETNQPVDTAEQIAAFQGLMNALDGRADKFHAMHIWQWHMTGSDGSLWNIRPTLPTNQPNNVPLGQWLSAFVNTAVAPLAGDYNRDGVVDAADYTVWRNSLGDFVAHFHAADGDGNGRIDEADYIVWKNAYDTTAGSGSIASGNVPEPATLPLAFAAFAHLLMRRRRRPT